MHLCLIYNSNMHHRYLINGLGVGIGFIVDSKMLLDVFYEVGGRLLLLSKKERHQRRSADSLGKNELMNFSAAPRGQALGFFCGHGATGRYCK